MNAKIFDDFWNEIVSDEIWFEQLKMRHPKKDWREAAMEIYTNYLADRNFPEMREVRKHLNNKLIYKKQTDEATVYRKPQEQLSQNDFHNNPLTDEERRRVDDLLNQYKQKIQQGFKPVVQMSRKEIEKYGAERLPKSTEYHLTAEEIAIQAREQRERIRACRIRVIKDRHPDLTDEEVEERLKQLES